MNNIKTLFSNIMAIMNIVIKHTENTGINDNNSDHIVSKLLEKGFRLDDIKMAMNLVSIMTSRVKLLINVGNRNFKVDGTPMGVRHLHPSEALRLKPDAQQMLLKLVEENVITQLHFEKVLEYILANDLRHVSVPRLELIILLTRSENELKEELHNITVFQSLSLH